MDTLSALLGTLLSRVIVVGAVLVSVKLLWEGAYVMASGLILAIAMFLYLLSADPFLLR
ncbi:MAG: hypothetical protein ABEJ43_02665 [Haloferacaceae archaeon]